MLRYLVGILFSVVISLLHKKWASFFLACTFSERVLATLTQFPFIERMGDVNPAYFIVYAAQFLSCSPGQKQPLLRQLRSEYLLIYRLQSHNNPKWRKWYLKQTGQQSFKEQVPNQRKALNSPQDVPLNIPTYVWDHQVGGSSPSTRTNTPRSIAPGGIFFVYCGAHFERKRVDSMFSCN